MSSAERDAIDGEQVPRSSSFAETPAYDADVRRDHIAVGPVRLPEEHSPNFIQTFNRTYQAYGLTIEPRAEDSTSEIPTINPLLASGSTLPEGE